MAFTQQQWKTTFIVAAVILLLIIVGFGVWWWTHKPTRPTPSDVTGVDTFNQLILKREDLDSDKYYVLRPGANITPPYVYKMTWGITKPEVPADTIYKLNIDVTPLGGKVKTLQYNVKGNEFLLNPLNFAVTGVSTYKLKASIGFKVDETSHNYNFTKTPRSVVISYLITDVTNPFRIPNKRDQPTLLYPPDQPFDNGWTLETTTNCSGLQMILMMLSQTRNDLSHGDLGFLNGKVTIASNRAPQSLTTDLAIPNFGIRGTTSLESWSSMSVYQETYPDFLLVAPQEPGTIPVTTPGKMVNTIEFEVTFGDSGKGYIRVKGITPIEFLQCYPPGPPPPGPKPPHDLAWYNHHIDIACKNLQWREADKLNKQCFSWFGKGVCRSCF